MNERYLRCPQVRELTGLGRSTIYDKMKRNEFPHPRKLGARAVAWPESAIRSWLESREFAEYSSA
ncbi:MAG TPA: AlpA family transcriptional regulator [Paracoccus solventivorans]|uniref:helix-turn-helix transcriptional regulator n=1 Tax=Paracoccus solventivorans TaxID=53463 RepID=UPI002C547C78|nr:AlpA family transcriptional regulator [Paracoccus solventivorans]HMM07884.1 AlpA family transcriptional regulator [Paracoccus solventivorans]